VYGTKTQVAATVVAQLGTLLTVTPRQKPRRRSSEEGHHHRSTIIVLLDMTSFCSLAVLSAANCATQHCET
jgi:hypothetical protein